MSVDGVMDAQASPADVAREFWRRMATNDFASVGPLLAPGFVLDWPQTRERIRGAADFIRMNQDYPAHGPWRFEVHQVTGDAHQAVSDVSITDGVQHARALSFFTVEHGLVTHLREFWPEPYTAPSNRSHLVERY